LSDADGDYEVWLAPSDGEGESRQLTHGQQAYFFGVGWAPDSKRLALVDQLGNLLVADAESGAVTKADTDPWGGQEQFAWSGDGEWLAYPKGGDNQLSALWLWEASSGKSSQLTRGMFNDGSPAFDRDGKYLYFSSNRDWTTPAYEDLGTTFVYADTSRLMLVPLRADVPSPWLAKNDEEPKGEAKKDEAKKDEKKDEGKKDDAKKDEKSADKKDEAAGAEKKDDAAKDQKKEGEGDKKDADKPKEKLKIDVEGFERRAL